MNLEPRPYTQITPINESGSICLNIQITAYEGSSIGFTITKAQAELLQEKLSEKLNFLKRGFER